MFLTKKRKERKKRGQHGDGCRTLSKWGPAHPDPTIIWGPASETIFLGPTMELVFGRPKNKIGAPGPRPLPKICHWLIEYFLNF